MGAGGGRVSLESISRMWEGGSAGASPPARLQSLQPPLEPDPPVSLCLWVPNGLGLPSLWCWAGG